MSVTNSFINVLALSLVVSNTLGGYRTENNPAKISSEQAMFELVNRKKGNINLSQTEVKQLHDIYYYAKYLVATKLADPECSDMWRQLNTCFETGQASFEDFSVIAKLPALFMSTPIERKIQVIEQAASASNCWKVEDWVNNALAFVYKSTKSKNFNGYNILATIDGKLVSWFSPVDLQFGLTSVTGRVKSTSETIDSCKSIFRLQYVKTKVPKFAFTFSKFTKEVSSDIEPNVALDLPWDV